MRGPDFIIIGTMKGGTTALYDFICAHDHVLPASQKEIHYFSLYPYKSIEWYHQHFTEKDGAITGEASPTYFDMATTIVIPKLIEAQDNRAKLILMVRDPIERAISHYLHLCTVNKIASLRKIGMNSFFDRDFECALAQSSEVEVYLNQVLSFGLYYRKYMNFSSVFPQDKLLVLRNEWLLGQPQKTMDMVFDYLQLPQFSSPQFARLKYSAGTSEARLAPKIRAKLERFYSKDYDRFLTASKTKVATDTAYVSRPTAKQESTSGQDNIGSHVNAAVAIKNTPATEPVISESTRSIDNSVAVGHDGWLFLIGGRNTPLEYFNGSQSLDDQTIDSWRKLLQERAALCSSNGIRFAQLFVPDKLSIYPEYFCEYVNPAFGPLSRLGNKLMQLDRELYDSHVINPTGFLKKNRDNYPIYWKTDSHWGFTGCFLTYQLLCAYLGLQQNVDLGSRPRTEKVATMDFGSKFAPPLTELVSYYNFIKDSRRVYANDIVRFKEANALQNEVGLHVGSNVVYANDNAQNKVKIVLFGTSYSEYRPHLLTGMLAETVSELHFVWCTSIDFDYVNREKPDFLIAEIAERFIPTCPSNSFSLERYSDDILQRFRNEGA
ncbi:MAG: sulfotransferase domain-containing protein [Ignavibacteriae bacterium]|nr:sulfotransferase domain-containing protein [Ignavibacteriota bacterium]